MCAQLIQRVQRRNNAGWAWLGPEKEGFWHVHASVCAKIGSVTEAWVRAHSLMQARAALYKKADALCEPFMRA